MTLLHWKTSTVEAQESWSTGNEAREEIRRNGGVAMENKNVGGRIKSVSWETPIRIRRVCDDHD
jgi:hypothetical protein